MADQDDAVSIKCGEFSLNVSKSTAVSRISNYAADIVGLVGEPAGYISRRMKEFFERRELASAIALIRAKQISEENKILFGAKSEKMLASWLDSSSHENIEGENILDIWAKLLVCTDEDFDAYLHSFFDVCRSIGPDEAKIINKIFQYSKRPDAKHRMNNSNYEGLRLYLRETLESVIEDSPEKADLPVEDLSGVNFDGAQAHGALVRSVRSVSFSGEVSVHRYDRSQSYFEAATVIESQRIFAVNDIDIAFETKKFVFDFNHLSLYGFDFCEAVLGDERIKSIKLQQDSRN